MLAAGTGEGATVAEDEGTCCGMASVSSLELEHSPPRTSGIGSTALSSGCSPTLVAPCEERARKTPVSGHPTPLTAPLIRYTGATGEPRSPPLATRASADGAEELSMSSLPAEAALALPAEDKASVINGAPLFFFFFIGAREPTAPFLFLDLASAVTFFA